ncbi:uncharacterized protein LOC116204472 [Punica granatum]|uniref:Uncharacterized protein n=2 Tax=Punica granatum TaxID=22663 RepID=A0A2I0KTI7_PUNGR|nr:uncharacterized protein LOC116204472 [Punica granatum]PKI71650.1 hypothetical protein CRG98_007973 [Punica granatum]
MAKAIIARTQGLLLSSLKQPKQARRTMSRFTGIEQQQEKSAEQVVSAVEGEDELQKLPLWVPHPRTGIYFPKGHESVMDDIPEGSASLAETYWLRSIDGVDKPDPNLCSHPAMS